MNWEKSKETTGKAGTCAKFLVEQKFPFQRVIPKLVSKHDITLDLVLNLDQTPLSHFSLGKYTFDLKGSTTVPVKVSMINDK